MIANPDPHIYLSPNYLVLDFETTGHARDPNADIVLACWTESRSSLERTESNRSPDLLLPYSPTIHKCAADVSRRFQREWGSCVSLTRLRRAIDRAAFVVAHHVKSEAGWLLRMGVDVRKITFYDTMLCEWVFFAGLPAKKGRLSLDGCARRYSVGVKGAWCKMLLTKEVSTKDIPKKELLTYCLEDVSLTEALFKKQKRKLLELEAKEEEAKKDQEQNQKKKLKEQQQEQKPEGHIYKKASASSCCFNSVGLHNIVYSRSMLAPVLADIELRGLQLDKLKVQTLYSEQIVKRQVLSEKLYTLTGGINLGSDKQKAAYLFDVLKFPSEGVARTKGNKQSTSLDTIRSLKATTEEQKQFQTMYLEYNDLDSSISKYLELFEGICSERNGLLLGELNQGRVSTHRLSSSGVPFKATGWKKSRSAQFQNLPRDFKKLFVAKNEGWLIGECDGSQLEFRIAAALSHDTTALQEINDLVDVHVFTAQYLGIDRQSAKPKTFQPLFGGYGKTPKEKKYCKFFRNKYKQIDKMQSDWALDVVSSHAKELTLPYGITYHFPEARMQADGYIVGTTNIYNFPIQGLATAECIPIALTYMWHHLPESGIEIVNTVHDSIIAEVRPDMVEVWKALCIEAMTFAVYRILESLYHYKLEVPLGIGTKIGNYWGDGIEQTFQVDNSILYEVVKDASGTKIRVPV